MTDDITISDRVQVDIDELDQFANYVAIPPAEPLEATYTNTKTHATWTKTVYGFTAQGHPLVLDNDGSRLVPTWDSREPAQRFLGVRRPETPPLTGPFTLAPAGLVAVFEHGDTLPVLFYDVHGRAVLVGEDEHRGLYLAEEDDALVRIEGIPRHPQHD